jgi:hypothetical protein
MRATILASVCLLALALVACSDGNDDPAPEPEPTSAAALGSELTPNADEIAWVESVCALDERYVAGFERLPGFAVNPGTLPLEQRRARAEALWEGLIALEIAYLEGLARITPVEGAETLQESIVGSGEETIADLRNGLDSAGAIFASVEALDANNEARESHELARQGKVELEFAAHPRLRERYVTHPTCPDVQRRRYRLETNA